MTAERRLVLEGKTKNSVLRLYRAPDRPGVFTYEIEIPDDHPSVGFSLNGSYELTGIMAVLSILCVLVAEKAGLTSLARAWGMVRFQYEQALWAAIEARTAQNPPKGKA